MVENGRFTKVKQEEKRKYDLDVELIQPWSVPVFKTTLPPDILHTMIEITDQIVEDEEAENHGDNLAGQIEKELKVEHSLLKQTGVMGFFLEAVRQFVITCKYQMMPHRLEVIQQENWQTEMQACWVVSQQPGEYNPLHVHTSCQISTVMYLKIPEMLPSRKRSQRYNRDDGSIVFVANCAPDTFLCTPNIVIQPKVGDFFIFGAQQQHAVYPYRCAEGQKDVERRSVSFNCSKVDWPSNNEILNRKSYKS